MAVARWVTVLVAVVAVMLSAGYMAARASDARAETPAAEAAGVTNVHRVFLKANEDAHWQCDVDEFISRNYWQCEGWWGGRCVRPWLTRPNYVFCGGVEYFMDRFDARASRTCTRNALYYGGTSGSAIRLVSARRFRRSPYRTTRYGCVVARGLPG